MAYCVRCGVKLKDSAKVCPLCRTAVVLPYDLEVASAIPLFDKPLPKSGSEGITKAGKGVIELILSLVIVSEITIALTMWFSGNIQHSFIPLFSTAMAAVVIALALMAKHTYSVQATIHIVLVSIYLLGLDARDRSLSWSLITVGGLFLFWMFGVFPVTKQAKSCPVRSIILMGLSPLAYLLMVNIVVKGHLSWFIPVALPTGAVFYLGVFLFCVLFISRKKSRIPIADLVYFILIVILLTFTALDLFSSHYSAGVWRLRWSMSMFSAALVLIVLLSSVSVSRRIRRYFTSQHRHD